MVDAVIVVVDAEGVLRDQEGQTRNKEGHNIGAQGALIPGTVVIASDDQNAGVVHGRTLKDYIRSDQLMLTGLPLDFIPEE